ncbi:MAG: TonB-dependent receptor [Paludibacteraceae bacterium]|nr:TonB-dependent receptor [Paludibacteraceae bacterium]
MRKLLLVVLSLSFVFTVLHAQTRVSGKVINSGDNNPLAGVKITLLQQNISTLTDSKGEFILSYIEAGDEELSVSNSGFFRQIKLVNIKQDVDNNVGVIVLLPDVQQDMRQEIVMQLSETAFDADDAKTLNISGTSSSSGDVYFSQTGFSFSPMRFNIRGYDPTFETTYINGVHFNSLERGGFNYSSLGGLNDAVRNQDEVIGLTPNSYSYGNIGSNVNINTRATAFAAGSKVGLAYTNRSYKLRGQYTYATGLQPNGWAFAASAVVRWADKGIVDGTFYNSAGYFLSAEKVLNDKHSFSLVTYGSPTQRAQQGAVTQEVYDLAGSIYYNPYWGYQNGKIRNSRIVKSFDPTVIFSHDFKIDENQRLRTGIASHFSMYSNSALGFYNAPDPRPDYYRYLPSAILNPGELASIDAQKDLIAEQWKSNADISQIDWESLYLANSKNNLSNPGATAKYMLERRHNNLFETALNSTYTNQFNRYLKLTAGVEAKYSKGMHYKTVDDLLGGNQWIDKDQFAERDFPTNPDIVQNDLNNPNREVKEGDIFGYNYDMNIIHASAFVQNEWVLSQLDVYYAGKVTYTQFSRFGHMKNGRAPQNSYGQGDVWFFVDPSLKAGANYKIDGRNKISANVLAETRAPNASNSYVSERIKDERIKNLQSAQILSYDLGYTFSFPAIRGRVSGFRTHVLGSSDKLGYYDDEERTFINHVLTNSNKLYQGIEAGLSVKLNSSFSLSSAGTVAEYTYINDAVGTKSPENGSFEDKTEVVLTKGLHIAAGPQLAANITLDYFHPKMWFADITVNYFDNNFLDFAPNRFTESNIAKYSSQEMIAALGTQEKLKGGFLVDASLGKVIYLKNRRSLNFNLSASNILNNTKMITGGYQQARLPLVDGAIDGGNLNKFPSKYYYAWGFNMFLNIGYKF